ACQTFGGPQRQVIDRPQRQHTANGSIGVVVLRPALRRAAIAPALNRCFIDPQREATSSNQRGVIGGPVAEAILRLLFHVGGVSALAIRATTPLGKEILIPAFCSTCERTCKEPASSIAL